MWNILIWGMRISQNLDFFAISRSKPFSCSFPLRLSRSFYSCCLLRFILFPAILKSWVLSKNKAWKLDLDQLARAVMGHFTTILPPKLITLTLKLLHQNAIKIRKRLMCR